MDCRSFREESPLVVLALRVLVLEHIGIGMPEKIALLIALEAKMQRMRCELVYLFRKPDRFFLFLRV